ncbi:hypothetical protein CCOS865_02804 [Pseudomonas reidholzensis]|uniref:Uncharacterized protein n=1 Tax=Pseudomonas reidholzensis TaxID=1785162 RepID=A0A383RTZ6_9PSED|nr:hypothetical protein [Pseudomonas reidholzensis]SYX90537.1 hypothetical protein CCOS865_02804 [Pseudomonas reidholzensis]
MIPIDPLAMMVGYLIYLFSQVFLWLLIAGLLALLFTRCRRYMLARRWRFALLAVGLAIGSVPFAKIEFAQRADQRAHQPRLEHEEVLGDLVLPAGTQVRLDRLEPMNDLSGNPVPYGLQSLKHADFDRTLGDIMGMRVRSLALWQGHGSATVESLTASEVQGWSCLPGEIEFRFPFGAHFNFSEWRLERCTLASGVEVGGVAWPPGSQVRAIELGRWRVTGDGTPMRFETVDLSNLDLTLSDKDRTVFSWEGQLHQPLERGPMQYLAGTLVSGYRDNLLFTPTEAAPAHDLRTGQPVEPGFSVEQSRAGEVLGMHSARDVRCYYWKRWWPGDEHPAVCE